MSTGMWSSQSLSLLQSSIRCPLSWLKAYQKIQVGSPFRIHLHHCIRHLVHTEWIEQRKCRHTICEKRTSKDNSALGVHWFNIDLTYGRIFSIYATRLVWLGCDTRWADTMMVWCWLFFGERGDFFWRHRWEALRRREQHHYIITLCHT